MDSNIINKVLEYMENLGNTINSGAEQGFEIMVRQHFVSGIVDITTAALVITLSIALVSFALRLVIRKWDAICMSDSDWIVLFFGLIAGIVFIAVIVFSVSDLSEGIKVVINPEYYAIQDILKTIKGGE